MRRMAWLLVLMLWTAGCTPEAGTVTAGRVASDSPASQLDPGLQAEGDAPTPTCSGPDPFAEELARPQPTDVRMIPVQPDVVGDAALRVVNDSAEQVGHGAELILQRLDGSTWTSVAHLNTSAVGRQDVIDRCDQAYEGVLAIGLEVPPGTVGAVETFTLPPLEDAEYRVARGVVVGDGGATLTLALADLLPVAAERESAILPLPATDTPNGEQAGYSGRLAGDAALDGGCVWVEDAAGERHSIIWPPGYRVRFHDAGFDLLAANGGVVATAGDTLLLGGGFHEDSQMRCDVDGSAGPFVAGAVTVEGPPRKPSG